MTPDPISDADKRRLKENFGDFVLEEPANAPKLLALRVAGRRRQTVRHALVDFGIIHETGAGGGMIKIRKLSLETE